MIVEIENLKKSYLEKNVLSIDSLRIAKGEKVAITGPNGCGKSTLLRLLLDLIEPDKGHVLLFGNPVQGDEKWKLRTSAFLDDSFLMDFLTVREYLHFLVNGVSDEQIHETVVQLNFTTVNFHEHIKNLSSGNKKKVGILGALLRRTELIIFDEVSNFLDYDSKRGLLEYFRTLRDSTVIIVEHNPEFIQDFATRLLVLDKGVIAKDIKEGDLLLQNIENLIQS